MTRSYLLAYLLAEIRQTPKSLSKIFGEEWAEAMRGLIDLGIVVIYHRRLQEPLFHVVPWKGMKV